MIKASNKWQVVEENPEELRRLVEENWAKGEWELAVLGESTIRTVTSYRLINWRYLVPFFYIQNLSN